MGIYLSYMIDLPQYIPKWCPNTPSQNISPIDVLFKPPPQWIFKVWDLWPGIYKNNFNLIHKAITKTISFLQFAMDNFV